METSAYRLLYDNIHDFKTTAVYVEAEIRRHNIRSVGNEAVQGMRGRQHHEMWASMKTVSHFNLGIALELMLKLILFLNKVDIPQHHHLARLYDGIPPQFQKRLDSTFQDSRRVLPGGFELEAFVNVAEPKPLAAGPPDRDVRNLRGFLEYFDEDLMLHQKRYSYELVDKGTWRHYLSDISVFVELINRVMKDIERY